MSARAARAVLERHSNSFSLAARLLPAECRDDAAVLYAWCRRADDKIDLGSARPPEVELALLRSELDAVYRGEPQPEPLLTQFQEVVRRRGIPATYPRALLDGLEMDLGPVRLQSWPELILYSYRVAGVVGVMMCFVLGVRDERAHRHATHLGIAMQLTNICRDVQEDWQRGRLYLPSDLLAECGGAKLGSEPGQELDRRDRYVFARAIRRLLEISACYYRSGDDGLPALSGRAAFAVRTARLVYGAIGDELARRDYDVLAGRAIVPTWKKLWLVSLAALLELLARVRFRRSPLAALPAERRGGNHVGSLRIEA